MARGGLSADPAKRAAQLARLAEGRAEAARRRAEGLPTKRTEQAREHGTGRVAPGRYKTPPAPAAKPKPAAKPSASSKPKPKPTRRPTDAEATPNQPPGRLLRGYARILGYA